jgi:hypothetical protein
VTRHLRWPLTRRRPNAARRETDAYRASISVEYPDSKVDALLARVECVLLDHAAELSGPTADAYLADLAHEYLSIVGDDAVPEIREALACDTEET